MESRLNLHSPRLADARVAGDQTGGSDGGAHAGTTTRSPRLRQALRFEPLVVLGLAPLLLFPGRWPGLALLASGALLALWALRWYVLGRLTRPTRYDGALVVILAATALSSVQVVDWGAAAPKMYGLLLGCALLYAVANSVTTPRGVWLLVGALLVAGTAGAGLALVGTEWTGDPTLEKSALLPLFQQVYGRLPLLVRGVVPGTLEGGIHPNEVAGVLLLPLLVGLGVLVFPWRLSRSGRAGRALLLGAVAFMAAVLALTQSRSGYAGFAVGAALIVGSRFAGSLSPWLRVRGRLAASVGVAIVALGLVALGLVLISSPAALSASLSFLQRRLDVWGEAARVIYDFPLTGIGLGQFHLVLYGLYADAPGFDLVSSVPAQLATAPPVYVPHAHNFYLQSALDLGIPGALAMGVVLVSYFRNCWQLIRGPLAASRGLGIGLAAAMAGFLVYGMGDTLATGARGALVIWATLGIAAAAATAHGGRSG